MNVNTKLKADWVGAYLPNPALLSKGAHFFSSVVGTLARLCKAKSGPLLTTLRPPGYVSSRINEIDLDSFDNECFLPHNKLKTVGILSNETYRSLPGLNGKDIKEAEIYSKFCRIANRLEPEEDMSDYTDLLKLLPPSITTPPLAVLDERDKNTLRLLDERTGFSASIICHGKRDVTIAFGSQSKEMAGKQFFRCVMNWLGFIPKNMSQASQLTQIVQSSLAKNHKAVSLTLTGEGMGGGLASYAALRNKVPAVVINPMRLGWGARAKVGWNQLEEASRYLTEIVVQKDWLADNSASKIYYLLKPLGFESRGPLGNARRLILPHASPGDGKEHCDFRKNLQAHRFRCNAGFNLSNFQNGYLGNCSRTAANEFLTGNPDRYGSKRSDKDTKVPGGRESWGVEATFCLPGKALREAFAKARSSSRSTESLPEAQVEELVKTLEKSQSYRNLLEGAEFDTAQSEDRYNPPLTLKYCIDLAKLMEKQQENAAKDQILSMKQMKMSVEELKLLNVLRDDLSKSKIAEMDVSSKVDATIANLDEDIKVNAGTSVGEALGKIRKEFESFRQNLKIGSSAEVESISLQDAGEGRS